MALSHVQSAAAYFKISGACDQKISTAAEKLLCMVKSYEYRYRAQDKPSQMQRRNRSIDDACMDACMDAWNGG
jgi:hypothetical protein